MKEKNAAVLLSKMLQDLVGPQQKLAGSKGPQQKRTGGTGKTSGEQVKKKIQKSEVITNNKQKQI